VEFVEGKKLMKDREHLDKVTCPYCGTVYFISERDEGVSNCTLCGLRAALMVPYKDGDCPIGCTLHGMKRKHFREKKDAIQKREAEKVSIQSETGGSKEIC